MAELDARRLYLGAGFSSLFTYGCGVLRLSESEAYNRIEAARVVRKWPGIAERLCSGALNLTTVRLLAPHLTAENHDVLVREASGKSKRDVEQLIARHFPGQRSPIRCGGSLDGGRQRSRAHSWMARFPEGPDRLEDLARKKLAAAEWTRPARPPQNQRTRRHTRPIPAAVKRAVWLRDGGRCAFRGKGGQRCGERGFLEWHHVDPHGIGGEATVARIELRCRAHNGYEAELFFGRGYCEARRARSGTSSPGP